MGQTMGLMMGTFQEFRPAKRKQSDYGLENALAKWVRNRWPDKTIPHVAHHFGLSESEAAKVTYATASKNTLRRLLHHRNGGAKLFMELVLDVTGYSLEQYISEQAREAEDEAEKWKAEQRRLAILAARVSGRDRLDGGDDQQARACGADDAPLGSGTDGASVEARSFAPKTRGRR
jgi:hypothetical protein